jgi:hypothetical protein
MTKLKKTARELAEMIAARMTSRGVRLNVLGDAVGWHAVVYGGAPCHVTKAQAEVDQIVQRLRELRLGSPLVRTWRIRPWRQSRSTAGAGRIA